MCFEKHEKYRTAPHVLTDTCRKSTNKMINSIKNLKNLIVICGHFGAGKTNLAVNLAKEYAAIGKKTTLVDLDIVNPYFRAADNTSELTALGVNCVNPDFANTNVDIPSLPPSVMGAIEAQVREPERVTILDVGGDNGAVALGMYNRFFKEGEYDLLYVVNKYRPLTEDIPDAEFILREIEWSGRIRATGIVNNSNLGTETTADDILDTDAWCRELAQKCSLPLVCTVADESLRGKLDSLDDVFYIKNATKQIF